MSLSEHVAECATELRSVAAWSMNVALLLRVAWHGPLRYDLSSLVHYSLLYGSAYEYHATLRCAEITFIFL